MYKKEKADCLPDGRMNCKGPRTGTRRQATGGSIHKLAGKRAKMCLYGRRNKARNEYKTKVQVTQGKAGDIMYRMRCDAMRCDGGWGGSL
jgi:hypothetical protein